MALVFDLSSSALPGRFVGSPAEQMGSMPKPAAGEMVVGNLYHPLGRKRLPFFASPGAPSAWATGFVARKSRRLDRLFELGGESRAVFKGDGRGKPDVVEFARPVVQAQKQRSDY